MRTEFVYSVIALGAIPVMANAADVNVKATQINAEVLQSANGKLDLGKFALAPGKYALKGIVTTNVYDVEIKVDGQKKWTITAGASAVELGDKDVVIDLTEKTGITEVAISLESTDPTESGADFTFGAPFINLSFDFAGAVKALNELSSTLLAKINGYAYSDAFESLGKKYAAKKEDADSLGRIDLKIGNIKTNAEASYDDYVNFKLYAEKSTIQEEIEALDAKTDSAETAYQNEQAYARVNAAITTIKGKYNAAVTELEQALVKEAAYLLGNAETENTAKYDLNENINKKITEATQASYASYTGKTAVDDEETNKAKIPSEETLNGKVTEWKGKATATQAAYDALHKVVTDLQASLDAVVVADASLTETFAKERAAAQKAIDDINTKVESETVKNTAAQNTLDVSSDKNAAEGKINTLKGKVTTANAEFNANKATTTTISSLQTNLNNAKTAVNALKSTDGLYEAKNYCAEFIENIQGRITKLSSDAAKAYKVDGTGTAVDFNGKLDVSKIQESIDSIAGTTEPTKVDGFPKQAVDKYDALQTAMAGYKTKLDAARDKVKDFAVYKDENYDNNYKTQLDLIQKRINDIKKNITAAQKEVGKAHWDAMLDIDADAAILTDIETLLSSVQGDQNSYDAAAVTDSLESLNKKILAFEDKDISKLGADVDAFKGVETEITGAYNAIVDAKNAAKNEIDAKSETLDYTGKVGKDATSWTNVQNGKDFRMEGSQVQVFGVTRKGNVITQEVEVENGTYDIEVFATSHNAHNGNWAEYTDADGDNPAPALQEDADDVAYVFGTSGDNTVKTKITAKRGSSLATGEPVAYTIKGVKVTNGKLTIGLALDKKGQTEWHTIQIKSLKANTASVLQGWGEKVTKLIADQAGLETFAGEIEAKVAANGKAKSGLATSIGDNAATLKTGLWKTIDDFKTTYKIGTAESTLGIRGKAGGAITTKVGELETALTTLQANASAVDTTAVINVDKTDKVSKDASAWGGSVPPYGDTTIIEKYETTTANTGKVMGQKVTGLDNGIYDVTLRANANYTSGRGFDGLSADANDVAYIFANDKKQYIPAKKDGGTDGEYTISNVFVTDGTLDLGMVKEKAGTNWHTIQIKSLTYHENSLLDSTYNNPDPKKLGLNKQYTKLADLMDSLATVAPGIVDVVKANANLKTTATKAVTDLQTLELNTLKSLKNVTNANAVSDDATAKKAEADFKVFETGLAADKSYTAKKAAIDADIEAMSTAIADSAAAETLASAWKNNSISVTKKVENKDVTTVYSIATITQAINNLKAEAVAESNNWEAYKALMDNNIKKLQPDTIFTKKVDNNLVALSDAEIAEVCGEAAKEYYLGLQQDYATKKATILTNMKKDLTDRKSASTKDAFVTEITNLIAKVKAVKSDAIANKKKYDEQKAAYTETQTLWNNTYTEIAATDHSTKVQSWLDELDVIQVSLTAATDAVENNYKVGLSVAQAKDFAAIQNAIKDVKARQNASYSEFVAADNKAAHESFMGYEKDGEHIDGAIDLATKAYQTAVEERVKYSATNAAIKAVVDAAAATLDAALYSIPDTIQKLTKAENEAYAAVVSPEVFNVTSFKTQANKIKTDVADALKAFKDDVKAAIQTYWTNQTAGFNTKVSDAEAAIDGYDADAKKDAFKDVKDLIAKGNAGVESWTLSEVEAAIDGLEDIDNMLAADKDAAAVKDIDKRIKAADDKYAKIKDDIEGKTIADDVNNVKATQLDNLEKAYDDKDDKTKTDVAYAKSLKKNFTNRDEAAGILDGFLTTADNCKKAVDDAIKADENNTKAYDDMAKAIKPVAEKLAEAKEAAAPYKYATPFATDEANLTTIQTTASTSKADGKAVEKKATVLANLATLSTSIEATLTTAFGTEKTGLSADITELKNQYNAYVAVNGTEAGSAYKTAIDALEKALGEAAIKDLDEKPDGIQYDEILAATDALIKLQNDIADKQTELLAANASTANADALSDFNTQIGALETAASLEGKDAWVGEQKVGDKKISDAIAEIQTKIADVKAAIQGEANISFYKDQYQAKLDAIKKALTPVANEIATKQAQFTANADAFTTLSAAITTLQGKVDAAKAKVGAYKHASTNYASMLEQYNDKKELTGGLQKTINDAADDLKTAKDNVTLTANSKLTDYGLNVTDAEEKVQLYLNNSAWAELKEQVWDLNVALTNALKYQADKFSQALWNRLVKLQGGIQTKIDVLEGDVNYSYATGENKLVEGVWQWVAKDRTSDADYADQMARVSAIAQEIADLADAMDNLSLLGDANEDNTVNVLDYQKVLNMILDPTAQPAGDSDLFQNVDINQNEVIEVGDLTAIVNYILTHDWNGYAAVNSSRADKMEGESLTLTQGTNRIAVNLANVTDYTAFQMDLVLPEGMKLVGAQLSDRAGESHKLYSRAQLDGSIRMVASSVKGETFSGNDGAVLYIEVEGTGTPELLNILFSDANAVTRSFAIGNDATGIDTVSTFESLKQKVYDLGGRVKNGLKKGINIIRRADGTTGKVVK